jgi:hypothetical protein
MIRSVVNAALFLAGLGLGCLGIGSLLPIPYVPQVKEKVEGFTRPGTDYTVLFFGTSRVRRHIMPAVFDRLAAEQGMPVSSFNMGIESLNAPEDGYVLDLALTKAPTHLRYVFLELSAFRTDFLTQKPDTIRAPYWHDWQRTRVLWRQLVARDLAEIKPPGKRKKARWSGWFADITPWADLMATHGGLLFQRTVNLGRGAASTRIWLGLRPPGDPGPPLGPTSDGFIPSDQVLAGAPLEIYRQQLAALPSFKKRLQTLDPVPQEYLETMVARVRAHGAEPILFIPPTVSGFVFRPRREVAPLIDFSDPEQWPALFDPANRADPGHLNTAGAEIFTRLLAERFFSLTKLSAEHR